MMTELSGLCSRLFDAALTSCYPGILMSLSTRQPDPPTTKFPDARYCTLLGFWFLLSALNTKFTSEIMKLFISWSNLTTQTTKILKYSGHFTSAVAILQIYETEVKLVQIILIKTLNSCTLFSTLYLNFFNKLIIFAE